MIFFVGEVYGAKKEKNKWPKCQIRKIINITNVLVPKTEKQKYQKYT
jgi:hypothetical protein